MQPRSRHFTFVVLFAVFAINACTQREDSQTSEAVEPEIAAPALVAASAPQAAASYPCAANANWVNDPYSPPTEIPDDGSDFCDFYQFSWQWFIHLMAPSQNDPSIRVFEDTANYPIWQADGKDSCTSTETKPQFFVRMVKTSDNSTEPVIPERIGQAGGGATIYDKNGNIVFYSVQFNRSLCDATATGDLPAGTTELKLAWRVISETEKANYVWLETDVVPEEGDPVPELLGLVGFHLVNSTTLHPEFVWASYEHKLNAPNCVDAQSADWSFTSAACVSCLQQPDSTCFASCNYNAASPAIALTGTASEICRVYPDGSAANDNKVDQNVQVVDELNEELVGANGIISLLPSDHALAVLKNYFSIGAIWESDVSLPSSDADNLRGSLQLANPVMETVFQGSLSIATGKVANNPDGDATHCFVCHGYTPGKTAEPEPISHIFNSILGSSQ